MWFDREDLSKEIGYTIESFFLTNRLFICKSNLDEFNTELLESGSYKFYLRYEELGGSNFTVTVNPAASTKSYLQVTKVNQGGDNAIMEIPQNMPFGTSGIKLIDFITAVQKKFNLVIYPNKTKQREFNYFIRGWDAFKTIYVCR